MSGNEEAQFRQWNYEIERRNPQPAAVPPAPVDIDALIQEYNAVEQAQEQRLGAIWSYMSQNASAQGFINFGAKRWATNTWRKVGPHERADISLGQALEGLIASITDYRV